MTQRVRSAAARRGPRRGWAIILLTLGVLLFLGPALSGPLIDYLWFREVGQTGVFVTTLLTRWGLGASFGVGMTGLVLLNLLLARRSAPAFIPRGGSGDWERTFRQVSRRAVSGALVGAAVLFGLGAGPIAAARWDDWLRFRYGPAFGVSDPIFGEDVGFYVFRLPFLEFGLTWILGALILAAVATGVLYVLQGAISIDHGRLQVSEGARAHLSALLGLATLARVGEYWLERYSLIVSPGGVVFGAGYSDVHARLPALTILAVLAAVAALGFLANTRLRVLWLPVASLGLLALGSLTVGTLYPAFVQQFQVVPNQQGAERPYIEHHLRMTRSAYDLDRVQVVSHAAARPLAARDLQTEAPTLQNIRLWDYRLAGQAFQQLQHLLRYYSVGDVDIDRYRIDGQYRQVMLAPRELSLQGLDARQRTWINERLQYTHGYGLVMSPVNLADPGGRPHWFIRDLPPRTPADIPLTRPQLYFGMHDLPPAVAPSAVPEIDFPRGGDNAVSRFDSGGGIPIGSFWTRWLFAWRMSDWNLMISKEIRPDSRILIRRHVLRRVASLAPFLKFDSDPYLVVVDGRMLWIQDAYTVAQTYPYSSPTAYRESDVLEAVGTGLEPTRFGAFNYIRNSVKIVVDAYSGAIRCYAIDENEPVLAAYRRAFPTLFRPVSELPAGVRGHLRYPADLFQAQCDKLRRFHVTNPDVFYQGSDEWDLCQERTTERQGAPYAPMEPYYMVMRLPGETSEEFVLMLPFKTRSGTTLTAWLAARCDDPHYGQLRLYRFPAEMQTDTPEQADKTIRADVTVSKEITLLSEAGSEVLYGNFLVLPVGQSVLYVKPMFVGATQSEMEGRSTGIPALKNVILAEKRGEDLTVVMRPTLDESLAALVGSSPVPARTAAPARSAAPGAVAPGVAALAAEAEAAFETADRALRSGDWAEYGRQIGRAREALRRIRARGE